MSRFKPRDTVARWIALTILIAIQRIAPAGARPVGRFVGFHSPLRPLEQLFEHLVGVKPRVFQNRHINACAGGRPTHIEAVIGHCPSQLRALGRLRRSPASNC